MTRIKGRWYCRYCGTAGWSRDGILRPHDRKEGGSCRASGQRSERELKRAFRPTIPLGRFAEINSTTR
jgi:hypothetical protein